MIAILNYIISSFGSVIVLMLSLLPSSPFQFLQSIDSDFLNAINYVFPVNSAVAHIQIYVVAVASYYAIRVILRWVKVVGQ